MKYLIAVLLCLLADWIALAWFFIVLFVLSPLWEEQWTAPEESEQ